MMEKHSLANYPTSFKGTVVSPTKICLQFQDVQVKLRRNQEAEGLGKMPDTTLALPVRTDGTDIEISSMGCQMPVLEDLQFGLINAYISYGRTHFKVYKETYNRDFIDFLLHVQGQLNNAIIKIKGRADED